MERKDLLKSNGAIVSISRYRRGERHAAHRDAHSRVSIVLAGCFAEEGRAGSVVVRAGEVTTRARSVVHANDFDEAHILSLEFADDDPFEATAVSEWTRRDCAASGATVAAIFLEAAAKRDERAASAAARDLVCAIDDAPSARRAAPRWLIRLKDEIEAVGLAGVNVAARARAAGAHPAHASRLFRACFGVSITEHAQAHGVRRAIGAMVADGPALGAVALAAGFYDQSHMNRAFRRVTGRSPGAIRDGLGASAG